MQEEKTNIQIEQIFDEVNKLIFVQDFDLAEQLVKELVKRDYNNCEYWFRYVEIASKTGRINELSFELEEKISTNKHNISLQIAYVFSNIRKKELHENTIENNNYTVNINNYKQNDYLNKKDVIGLSSEAEFSNFQAAYSLYNLNNNIYNKQDKVRLVRNPLIKDDSFIDINNVTQMFNHMASEENEVFDTEDTEFKVKDFNYKNSILHKAEQLIINYSEHFGAWYVWGCANEQIGHLQEALEAWKKSNSLNPNSISVLATLSELQQIGVLATEDIDYSKIFEQINRFLVHGSIETHILLYQEFFNKQDYNHAIAALRTLADWLQRQKGYVPSEIEILCLCGAMKVYKENNNYEAQKGCEFEIKKLVKLDLKRVTEPFQLKFIGDICLQFDLKDLALSCYVALVSLNNSNIDLVVEVCNNCLSMGCSDEFKRVLKIAYSNHKGSSEIRFCMVISSLALAQISTKNYFENKSKIRDLLSVNNISDVLPLLLTAYSCIQDDPEINYYLAEVYSHLNLTERALLHFEKVIENDYLNFDSMLRYGYFLLKIENYEKLNWLCQICLAHSWMNDNYKAEFLYMKATAFYATTKISESYQNITEALNINPWNNSYLALCLKIQDVQLKEHYVYDSYFLHELETVLLQDKQERILTPKIAQNWLNTANQILTAGYIYNAYILARCLIVIGYKIDFFIDFFIKASASYNQRISVQNILQLNQSKNDIFISLTEISVIIARIYAMSAEWVLMDEWTDIANKSGLNNKWMSFKLLEIESLKYAVLGINFNKAQHLLEIVIEFYNTENFIQTDTYVLLSYVLVMQGNNIIAYDKLKHVLAYKAEISIVSLYFIIKTMERLNKPFNKYEHLISQLLSSVPHNLLERKFINDIFVSFGSKNIGCVSNIIS